LLNTDVENLTPDGCEKLASGLGLESAAYRACVQDPATQSKIDADKEEFHAAKGKGLPTIWVNDTPLLGEQSQEMLEDAVKSAIKKTAPAG
jgi:2-hydroxychromene-2-carboxylate isomerase